MPIILKRLDLKSLLPHRGTALCLDRAAVFGHEKVRCIYSITTDDPKVDGHFPETPINPGHWLIEAMALSGALLINLTNDEVDRLPLFREVLSTKFYGKVQPPARIFLIPSLIKARKNKIFTFDVLATQNGTRVATARIKGVVE